MRTAFSRVFDAAAIRAQRRETLHRERRFMNRSNFTTSIEFSGPAHLNRLAPLNVGKMFLRMDRIQVL
jgi:hypothetical protein